MMQTQTVKTSLERVEQVSARADDQASLREMQAHARSFEAALKDRVANIRGVLLALEDLEEQARALQLFIEHKLGQLTVPSVPAAANDAYDFGADIAEPLRAAIMPFLLPTVAPVAPEAA